MPGVLMMEQPPFKDYKTAASEMAALAAAIGQNDQVRAFPLIVVCDPFRVSLSPAEKIKDFLWITFTRANPSHDIYGVNSFTEFKHWGCEGSLVIDARLKPHHAPPLMENPDIARKVDALIIKEPALSAILK